MNQNSSILAVVTGANRGIGQAAAFALAKQGCSLALLGRTVHELEDTAHCILKENSNCKVFVLPCDVSCSEHVEQSKIRILSELGVPSVVVNNAGVVHRAFVEQISESDWDHVLDINLKGPFLITRAFLPSMRQQQRGRFVHIASISATIGTPQLSAYCASKWGLLGFHKALTEELRGTGLQSIAIAPGSVDTDMLKGSGFEPQMKPEDVAKTIIFAALNAPNSMHGATLEIYGA